MAKKQATKKIGKKTYLKVGFLPIEDDEIADGYKIDFNGVVKDKAGKTVQRVHLTHIPGAMVVLKTKTGKRGAYDVRYLRASTFFHTDDWQNEEII